MKQDKIVVFKSKDIRRLWHDGEWFFSVVDVVGALTESVNPRDYWFKMKSRVATEDGVQLSTICRQLKLESSDGKKYLTDCANTKALFRIIQSIPSPKAEPFKQWLAKVGYERVQEIENPELAQELKYLKLKNLIHLTKTRKWLNEAEVLPAKLEKKLKRNLEEVLSPIKFFYQTLIQQKKISGNE